MSETKIFSADSHVVEPADVWTARIDARFRDRAPHIIKGANGIKGDFFVCEGLLLFYTTALHDLRNILLTVFLASFLSLPLAGAASGTVFLSVADEASELQESIQPSPNLPPVEVVRIQVEALKKNDIPHPNRGIEIAFRFASPENKMATGPLERFTQMVSSPVYRSLLNHQTAEYGPIEVMGDLAVQPVTLTAEAGEKIGYVFSLSKQEGGPYDGCWMTDGVSRFAPQEKAKEPMLSI